MSRRYPQPFEQVDLVDIDDALVRRAGDLAASSGLGAYDAVHVAVCDADLVVVAGDRALLAAAATERLATASTSPE